MENYDLCVLGGGPSGYAAAMRAGRRQFFTVSSRRHAVAGVVAQLPEACRALPQVCRGDGVLPVGACQIIADNWPGVSARSGLEVWARRCRINF